MSRQIFFWAMLILLGTAHAADAPAPQTPQLVLYFTAWGKYDDKYFVKNIETSGTAAKATVIIYAFANVKDNRCVVGVDKTREGAAGDDYWYTVPAAHTLDGNEDKGDNGLFGHWNQFKQLKKKYPQLKVLLSLGGWTWSKHFSDAALPQHRSAFVKSCVDAFIKGDVPDPQGKIVAGLAAGVFDGIDIDWEFPGVEGNKGNVVRPEDKQNFTALLQEFRSQLDAVKPGLLLTIASGTTAKEYAQLELDKIAAPLNWINIMGYNYTGPWSTTSAPHAPLFSSAHDPGSIERTVGDFLKRGVPPGKIVVGVPFYGAGWKVSKPANHGLYQPVDGALPNTNYDKIKTKPGEVFHDEKSKGAWKFDGKEVWVYDDPLALKEKAAFVRQHKLAGMMAWELAADTDDGELVNAIYVNLIKP